MSRAWLAVATLGLLSLAADPVLAPPPANPAPGAVPIQPPPTVTPPSDERCDAGSLAYLVGRSRTDIPTPIDPENWRIYCSSCVITQDYRPERTDIVYDDHTGRVTAVKCG